MKPSLKYLVSVVPSLSLFTIGLNLSSPAKASLPCQDGSIGRYQNGSVESCIINANVSISQGALAFSCKQGQYIYFDDRGNFRSCVISIPVVIRTANDVETCPEESRVYVSIENGNQSARCQR